MISNVNTGICHRRIQENKPPYFVNWVENGEQHYQFFSMRFLAEGLKLKLNKNMDLLSAKREAQLESKKLKKTVYVIVDDEGECTTSGAPLKGAIFAYTKGAESPLPPDAARAASENKETQGKASKPTKEKQTKTTNNMATKKKTVAKKASKKSASSNKRAIYGVGKLILETLQKGGVHTKEALVKKFKMAHPGHVNFHVSLIRKNGHNVELTDKGYKLTK